jgi:hypothetical protein
MPFCPKCWEEYPKGFSSCNVCDVPLTDEKPDSSKHESHKHPEPSQAPPKSESSKTKKS